MGPFDSIEFESDTRDVPDEATSVMLGLQILNTAMEIQQKFGATGATVDDLFVTAKKVEDFIYSGDCECVD